MSTISTALRRAVEELLPMVGETLTFQGNSYACISDTFNDTTELTAGGFEHRITCRFMLDAQMMLTTDSTLITMDSTLYTMDSDSAIPVAGNRNVLWRGREVRVIATEYRQHSETIIMTCGSVDQ